MYSGISREEIEAQRTTSEGKTYTLNHPDGLVIDMRYKGEEKSNANSQGWERSSTYYFKQLQSAHPEYFSKKNTLRIENGESPKVDAQFVKNFPQYHGYENETLIHHHIGKDGQAVAVPQSIHKGSGEIHTIENELGITDNAKDFSEKCKQVCERNNTFYGKTSSEFHQEVTMSQERNEGPILKRNITPEIQQSRERDTAEVLGNYRESLENRGVTDSKAIDTYIEQEHSKIQESYDSLDRGDEQPNMYQTPTNWDQIADSIKSQQSHDNAFSKATNPAETSINAEASHNAFRDATVKSGESTSMSGGVSQTSSESHSSDSSGQSSGGHDSSGGHSRE